VTVIPDTPPVQHRQESTGQVEKANVQPIATGSSQPIALGTDQPIKPLIDQPIKPLIDQLNKPLTNQFLNLLIDPLTATMTDKLIDPLTDPLVGNPTGTDQIGELPGVAGLGNSSLLNQLGLGDAIVNQGDSLNSSMTEPDLNVHSTPVGSQEHVRKSGF
jgi:hypothetical protein